MPFSLDIDADDVLSLTQALMWLRFGIEGLYGAAQAGDGDRAAALFVLLREHPCIVEHIATMDRFVDRLCAADGKCTGDEKRALMRQDLMRQADAMVRQAKAAMAAAEGT